MAEAAKSKSKLSGFFKTVLGAVVGLASGVAAMYATVIVDRVAKPPKPVANFAISADGLTVTCQSRASGESGWWDFGDGSPLEPFDSGQQTVSHTYAKPGNYAIKLIVRNFIMEENDRTVPVDLSTPPQQLPPTIALQVEPINPTSVAPATFRIRGEVKNADRVLVDLGDRIEVATEPGPFERLVVFDKPGQFPIQLIGHTGKQAVKQSATVTVTAAPTGSLSVFLRVTDIGTKVERRQVPETAIFSAPSKGAANPEKTLTALRGYTIKEAKLGKVTGAAVKNAKVQVAADGKTAKVSGEWAGDPAKGGTETIVQVTFVQERQVNVAPMTDSMSATFTTGTVTLPLPPAPAPGVQRKMSLEFRQATAGGATQVVGTVAELPLPWTGKLGQQPVSARQVGNTVQVTYGQ